VGKLHWMFGPQDALLMFTSHSYKAMLAIGRYNNFEHNQEIRPWRDADQKCKGRASKRDSPDNQSIAFNAASR